MIRTSLALPLAALATAFALFVGCSTTDAEATRCVDIPANGCPSGDVDVCTDPTCAAAYDCNPDGTWSLDHTCPGFHPVDAGRADDAGRDAGEGTGTGTGGSVCIDAGLPPGASLSYGGLQCPDLEPPDCPLGEVLVCSTNAVNACIETGCQGLFYCDSMGWHSWGDCEDDGGLVLPP